MVQQPQVRVLLWLYLLDETLNDAEVGEVLLALTWYMMQSASQKEPYIFSGITPLIPEISNLVCSQRHPQEMSHEPDLYKFAALGHAGGCLSSVFIQAS